MDWREGWLWRELVRDRGLNEHGRLRSDPNAHRVENGNVSARATKKRREQENAYNARIRLPRPGLD